MSRSVKKAIVKDSKPDKYWKQIRSTIKNTIRSSSLEDLEELEIPDPKTIVNDYDYCDWTADYEHKSFASKRYSEEDYQKDKKEI